MSQREKAIASLVGVAVVVLLTVVLVRFFLNYHTQIKKDLAASDLKMKQLRGLESERKTWEERDAWLTANMPQTDDNAVAAKQLTDAVKEIAKTHTVTLEAPNQSLPSKQPNYTAIGIRISARAAWGPLAQFIQELQAPGKFMVLDSVDLKVDPNDKTQMKAEIAVSKWFAPQK